MGTQVCFTADDNLVSAIDEVAKKIQRSRSDTISTILWLAIQSIRTKQPKDLGELMSISGGTGVTAPAGFQVEKQFTVTEKGSNELADLRSRFVKALDQAVSMRMSGHALAVNVKGQRRLFYTLKKLGEDVKPNSTIQTFLALSQELQPVRLTVTMTRDPQGYPGRVEGTEEPISRDEAKEYDLSADRVLALIQRFVGGDLW
jgi:metal-responsive CopG/Arc/MetJ family transcriptional regulator